MLPNDLLESVHYASSQERSTEGNPKMPCQLGREKVPCAQPTYQDKVVVGACVGYPKANIRSD
jgi:hypothetical protein